MRVLSFPTIFLSCIQADRSAVHVVLARKELANEICFNENEALLSFVERLLLRSFRWFAKIFIIALVSVSVFLLSV